MPKLTVIQIKLLYNQRNTSTPDLNSTQVQLEKLLEVRLKTPQV
jgi:hypothetical protein